MRSIELFAGAGGLALGTHLAGFSTEVAVEWNSWCCSTLRANRAADYPLVRGMEIHETDIRDVDWGPLEGRIDLLSGGPPCQPFSAGGLGLAEGDPRNMFPATADVIKQVKPRAFLIENVRGLTRPKFADYFQYIQLQLSMPEIRPQEGETWRAHLARLLKERTSSAPGSLRYRITSKVVNAADFGVPQNRWRVFLVGFRDDCAVPWRFPDATHSQQALEASRDDGRYWGRHAIAPRDMPSVTLRRGNEGALSLRPWRTVRDALAGLPEPNLLGSSEHLNHFYQGGARSYPGHTGSDLDSPAKALKAGVHGVPGGENMIRFPDGALRYFSTREAARLQTFPDRFALHGPWTEAMRQLGNAVPVRLAELVALSVREHLDLTALQPIAQATRALQLAA